MKITEKMMNYFIGILVVVGLLIIILVSISLDYSSLIAAGYSLMLIGVMLIIMGFLVIVIPIVFKSLMKKVIIRIGDNDEYK